MEIEVHEQGGVLGTDRRYVVKDGTIEVIEEGRSRGARTMDPQQAARIDALATSAAGAPVTPTAGGPVSDSLETKVDIRQAGGSSSLRLRSGDDAPVEVWDLIDAVSRASGG